MGSGRDPLDPWRALPDKSVFVHPGALAICISLTSGGAGDQGQPAQWGGDLPLMWTATCVFMSIDWGRDTHRKHDQRYKLKRRL